MSTPLRIDELHESARGAGSFSRARRRFGGGALSPLLASAVLLLFSRPAASGVGPGFGLSFRGPWHVEGEPGASGVFEFEVMLSSSGFETSDEEIQAWSFGVSADGWTIVDATTSGTVSADRRAEPDIGRRIEGFEHTEVLAESSGSSGVISAVVLGTTRDAGLPVEDGPYPVLRIRARTTFPGEEEDCRIHRLDFADGLQGSGDPVENTVSHGESSWSPSLASLETEVCADGPYRLRIGGELEGVVVPGVASGTLRPEVILDAAEAGVRGWSMSIESSGDCEIVDATTAGGVGGDIDDGVPGLRRGGFEITEIVPPEANGGRSGVVSSVVLSFAQPVVVPVGEHRVLAITLGCDTEGAGDGAERAHRLFFPSNFGERPQRGQLLGSTRPVKTVLSVGAATVTPQVADAELVLRVRAPRIAEFVRCDPNGDRKSNLADVVWLVNELFRDALGTPCLDAGDCNDDEFLDLSDAVFAIEYQFAGGSAPAAPFPGCGSDAGVTEERCPAGSTSCP